MSSGRGAECARQGVQQAASRALGSSRIRSGLGLDLSPGPLKNSLRRLVEKYEINFFERSLALEMLGRLAKHDLRTVFQGKSRDAGAHRRKCDCFQAALIGYSQGMRRGMAQRVRTRLPPELHAGRMNHESHLQFSARGDGRITDRDTADGVAFALDLFSSFAADGSSNARAQDQIVVGRVDDGVRQRFDL